MKIRFFTVLIALSSIICFLPLDSFARGGRGGGARGGGGARMGGGGARMGGGGFSPSMSRPSGGMARPMPAPRPNVGGGARPGGMPGGARPGGVAPGARPGAGAPATRPGAGGAGTGRPSARQLNDFLNVPRPGTTPSARPGAGGAASDFLKGNRPSQTPAPPKPGLGGGLGGSNRPGVGDRPGTGGRPGVGDRPGIGEGPIASNRPDRIQNREERQGNRMQRRDQVWDQIEDRYPRLDFWADHPGWANWRLNAPYRWAAWGALTGWLGYGYVDPYPYAYGESVYYQDDMVYSGSGEAICSADEYATQAEQIATSAPEAAPEQSEWMPLGVFALTQDGDASGATPTRFMQLMISKDGVINGLLNNKLTGDTSELEGMVDKESQRAAWTVKGKTRPIIETGLTNLTSDTGPALIHFAEGTTQQVLLVRLPEPKE